MAAALRGQPGPLLAGGSAPGRALSRLPRHWAPCAALALLAVVLFYVALTNLLKESAARGPLQASVTPAVVQPPLSVGADEASVPQKATRAVALPVRAFEPPAAVARASDVALLPVAATPVTSRVTKCITPAGTAEYSDGPCADGSRVATLHLQ